MTPPNAYYQSIVLADVRHTRFVNTSTAAAQALHQEWERGKHRIGDGFEGAGRFAGGEGRHGKF